jgi:hypothetical protein
MDTMKPKRQLEGSLPARCDFCKANQATRSLMDLEGHALFLCSDCNQELMWAYALG